MIFGNIWGLLGLLSIPVILALHLFRRRFKPKTVSTLFLFGQEEYNQASGRTREKIRRSNSLLAELLAALAFTWFMCDPHLSDYQQARHVICILDSHQRLLATDDAGTDTQTKVKTAVLDLLHSLESHDRVTLIRSGKQAQLLTATAVPVPSALLELERYQSDQPYHDMQASIEMAIDLQSASEQAQVIVFSDHLISNLPAAWQTLSYGKATTNSGLIDARWFDDERGQRIALRIYRHDDHSKRRVQILDAQQKVISESQLSMAQGMQQIIIPLTPSTLSAVRVELDGEDSLAVDDSCSLVKPPRLLLNVSVDKNIQRRSDIIRALKATHKVQIVDTAAHIHFSPDRVSEQAGTWSFVMQAANGNAVIGPFLARSGHPLLQDLDFTGVLWSKPSAQLPTHRQSLLQSAEQCLISEEATERNQHIYCHIDLEQSSLHRHPAWPSLFANLIAWRAQFTAGLQHHHLSTFMSNRIVVKPGKKELYLQFPNQEIQLFVPDAQGVVLLPRMRQTGIYTLSFNKNVHQEPWQSFIVHSLDERSSNLSLCTTDISNIAETESGKVQRIRTRLEHISPLAIAILAALAAWFFYRREQGIQS